MRKGIAIVLVCLLALSLSVMAMADTPDDYEPGDQPDEYIPEEGEETSGLSPEPTPTPSPTPKPELSPVPPSVTFEDVPVNAYFYAPVSWAVVQGITTGTGNNCFSPNIACTRGQIVTFLWRAAGKPESTGGSNHFTDVKPGDYFYTPVQWAAEKNITGGTGTGTFSPGSPCTRSQAVTFLWRAAGKPDAPGSGSFTDLESGSYYEGAVNWAVDNGVTSGVGDGKFNPGGTCTRGQIVTMLYRDAVD